MINWVWFLGLGGFCLGCGGGGGWGGWVVEAMYIKLKVGNGD